MAPHLHYIHKAQPIRDEEIPDFHLITDGAFPQVNHIDGQALHERDATTIATALHRSLPGGTWDRLIAVMLRTHASNLRTRRWEPKG